MILASVGITSVLTVAFRRYSHPFFCPLGLKTPTSANPTHIQYLMDPDVILGKILPRQESFKMAVKTYQELRLRTNTIYSGDIPDLVWTI